jgi:glycosyltransferase involved in cell wall biosynthesis
MANPKVSVLIATYNRANLIGRAIQSVLNQTFTDWELIIADDGSTDNTAEVVKKWQRRDSRIKYLRSEHLGRISKISNFGLRKAKGEYLAVLDDDDYWATSDKLKKQVEFLDKNPEYVGCGGGYIVIDENGREKGRFLKPELNEEIKLRALIANPLANLTTMFRRAVAEKLGYYDETMPQFADWDFWLKMGLAGKLYNFQEYFAYYQMWEGGSSFRNQKENVRAALRIIRRYRTNYPGFIKAFFLGWLYAFYASLPMFLKKPLNSGLSLLKKFIFSRKS